MLGSGRFLTYIRYLLFGLYFLHGIIIINNNSVVSDETEHLLYGLRVLKGHPEKIYHDDASTQPISALNALPRAIQQVLSPSLTKSDGGVSDALQGRYISLLICFFIGVYIYKWSGEMFGEKAGLFSLFLFTFCPNLQAYIPLVGTDAYAALFTLTSAYYFRQFVLYSGWRNFILFSVHCGLALTVKQSLFLVPLLLSIIALVIVLQRGSLKTKMLLQLKRGLVFIIINLFIINASFLFKGTGTSLNQYNFKSDTFTGLQQQPVINRIPLPLPTPFLEGYDGVKYMIGLGSGHSNVSPRSYLLGEYFVGNSKWYYYSVVILFKTPLAVLIMLMAIIAAWFRRPFSRKTFFTFGFPLTVAFFFVFFISLTNTSQHSLRHLLMIYPFFYISFGLFFTWKISWRRYALPVVAIYSLVTFYSFLPNLLSYTNELIWQKKNAYKVLASSNINYGQGHYSLMNFLSAHPAYKEPGAIPMAGNYVVSINDYLDLYDRKKHAWLNNFAPDDHVNHCYLLFSITEKDLLDKNLK